MPDGKKCPLCGEDRYTDRCCMRTQIWPSRVREYRRRTLEEPLDNNGEGDKMWWDDLFDKGRKPTLLFVPTHKALEIKRHLQEILDRTRFGDPTLYAIQRHVGEIAALLDIVLEPPPYNGKKDTDLDTPDLRLDNGD